MKNITCKFSDVGDQEPRFDMPAPVNEGEEGEMLKKDIAMSLEEQLRVSVKGEEEEEILTRVLALSMVESRVSIEEEESEV